MSVQTFIILIIHFFNIYLLFLKVVRSFGIQLVIYYLKNHPYLTDA